MILYKVTTIMTQTSRIRDLTQKQIIYKVEKVEKDTQFFLRKIPSKLEVAPPPKCGLGDG